MSFNPGIIRTHRTLLVIKDDDDKEYCERVHRLQQSVNGPNIKVDTVVVDGFRRKEVRSWAADQGYTMVVFAEPAIS